MGNRIEKKHFVIIISTLIFALSLFVLYLGKDWLFTNPSKPYMFSDISYASRDAEGNTYAVNNSSMEILKISPEGELLWKACASDKSFLSARRVVADIEGNIYVHDVRIAQGVRVESERIVKLSQNGKYISTIDIIEAEDNSVKQSIVGLVPLKNGVIYIKKGDNSITLYNTEQGKTVEYQVKDAENMVLCCAYDNDNDVLFYATYDGKIYKYSDGNEDVILYDSDNVEGSIPQEISYSDGILYSADIGLRDTIRIYCETGLVDRMEVQEPIEEREIAYNVSAVGNLITSTSYSIIIWDGEDYEQIWEVPLSKKLVVCSCLVWISLIIVVIGAVILLIKSIKMLIKKFSFYAKITIAVIVGIAGIAVLFIGTLFPKFHDMLEDEIYTREKFAATAITSRFPSDAFENLEKPSDFMNEDYKQVRQVIRDVFFTEEENADDLYCVLYKVIDGTVTLVYTLEDICVVYPYDWEYEGTELQDVMEQGNTVAYATQSSAGSFVFIHSPIRNENGEIIGIIEVGTDMQSVTDKSQQIQLTLIINLLAITVIVFMVVFELIYFMKGRHEVKIRKQEKRDNQLPVEIFRFIVFLIFFFTNLTCAILPIYAMRIAENMSSSVISPVMLAAIPISAEVVSGAVFSAFGGKVIRKLGAKKSILVSSILFTAGLGLRVIPNIWILTASSLLLGAGWGILLLLVNIMIVELPDEEKDRGYAYYSVSAISGANCAVVLGGFLLQWMSYTALFAVTAGFSILLFFVSNKYMSKYASESDEESVEEEKPDMNILKFVLRPRIIGYFILLMIPLLICGYFMNYMFPIIGSEWGLSETYIGYAYILNGIFVLMLGTPLTEFFSSRGLKHIGLCVSALLYAAAFLEVAVFMSVPSLLIALILIGIADSFGIPLLTSYFTDLKDVERYGYDRALGVYSLFENGAQSLGSFVFGYVLLLGVNRGLKLVLLVVSILAVIFGIWTTLAMRKEKRGLKHAKETKD